MHDEREKSRDETEDSGQQQPIGQDSPKSEFGGIGREEQPATSGSEPPRSSSDQQDMGQNQPGKAADATGEGFIAREAPEGQGAKEGEEEDVEGGQPRGQRTDAKQE